jgi:hypothetical protein
MVRQTTRRTGPSKPAGMSGSISLIFAVTLFMVVAWVAADDWLAENRSGPFIGTGQISTDFG